MGIQDMFRKTLAGLIIAVAAVGVAPIAASAAVQPLVTESAASEPNRASEDGAVSGGMLTVMGLWAGAGVLGLAGGMVTIATITRKQKPQGSRVAAALS
jgi:hypothetical protein